MAPERSDRSAHLAVYSIKLCEVKRVALISITFISICDIHFAVKKMLMPNGVK